MTIKLVAVTGCISGVAHTYMAAERLEKICQHEKWQVKIETQGALGIENALTEHDIRSADVVLLIADIELEGAERFAHCPLCAQQHQHIPTSSRENALCCEKNHHIPAGYSH
jgi:fructose-like PTS system EIIB component